jgi:hypothetical protein
MDETLTPNTVADIQTEFALEREKLQIERARIDLERERLAAERERWQNESEWRVRASGRMVPVSTLVYVAVICVLASGIGGWFGGNLVAKHEVAKSDSLIKSLVTTTEEGAHKEVIIQRPSGHNIRLLFE